MASVEFQDNSAEVLRAMEQAKERALEIIGQKAESYAAALIAPLGPKGNPMRTEITLQIRDSIGHRVDGDTVEVGSDFPFSAYVELGTGNKYQPSEEWIQTTVKKGKNAGLDKWFFYDEEQRRVRIGLPIAPKPFLRPAVEDHKDEYEQVVKRELENAG